MGDQVEQMAEAVVTDEAEQPERLKKTDWPRGSRRFRHLGNRVHKARIEEGMV